MEGGDGFGRDTICSDHGDDEFPSLFQRVAGSSSGRQGGLPAAGGPAADFLAVLAGAEAFTDIARFGERKIELLRRFRPYVNGTPSHDHLGDIFATLDARAFQLCFVAWVAGALTNTPAEVIAIDGKTSRRSYQTKGSKEAIHMVSAFAARQRIVLGQVKVNEKSNEIIAIPALLDMMSIEGAVVTIDAMGCQRDITTKIIEKKADYIVALKGNQGTLREDVEVFVAEQKALKYRVFVELSGEI